MIASKRNSKRTSKCNRMCSLLLLVLSIVVAGLILPMPKARAENQNLTDYFSKKISQIQRALSGLQSSESDPTMEVQDMNIDIAPSATFGVSEVLSLTVSPEINFVLAYEDAN
jgi:hypothetical protein